MKFLLDYRSLLLENVFWYKNRFSLDNEKMNQKKDLNFLFNLFCNGDSGIQKSATLLTIHTAEGFFFILFLFFGSKRRE